MNFIVRERGQFNSEEGSRPKKYKRTRNVVGRFVDGWRRDVKTKNKSI